MIFELKGKFKPYVRMTQASKWVQPDAVQYLASKEDIGRQLAQQMAANDWDMLPGQTPLWVSINIEHQGGFHNRDLDNELKAFLDGANGIVYPDDRWIDWVKVQRQRGKENKVRMVVELAGGDAIPD